MRPNWDPRGGRHGVKPAWKRFAGLMAALLLGSIASTTLLGFSAYACGAGPIGASPGSVLNLVPPIPGGERVSLKEAVRSARFPVLLPPSGWSLADVWLASDGRTVAVGLDPREGDDVIYIKEFDRRRAERDEFLDHSLRALPEAFEIEVSGLRAIAQPVCSDQDQRRLGPRLRTGTLYLFGGRDLAELVEIAETMLREPPTERAERVNRFHH